MLDGSGIIAFEWSFAGLALLFVLMRIYVKVWHVERIHDCSDYVVVAAWLNFAAACAIDTVLFKLGFTNPKFSYTDDLSNIDFDREKNIKILKLLYASTLPYIINLWLIKAGVLCFYFTVIPKNSAVYRFALHFVAGFCAITFVLVFVGNMFWCSPIRDNWSLDGQRICIASALSIPFYGTVASTITTDLMIFCLPFPLVLSMSLPRRKMVGVIFLFTLGSLTIIAAICRVIAISISATVASIMTWSAVECSTGIMVACAPALRVLLLRRERSGSNHSRSSKSKRSYPRHPGPSVLSAEDRNEIWDGSDASAPQWIRMASISGNNTIVSPKSAQFDESVDSALSKQLTPPQKDSIDYGSSMSDFSMVTAIPNIRLQIGRGIVENATMGPISPRSSGQSRSEINPVSPLSSVSTTGDSHCSDFLRLGELDDTLPCMLNRWDTGESGRLELGRMVDIAAGVNRPRSMAFPNNGPSRLGMANHE